jgi:hypothetical protein
MKTLKTALVIGILFIALGLDSAPAKAYFYQQQIYVQPYQQYQNYYNPYQPRYQNVLGQLVQGNLNLVNSFTYIPAPVHQYFYNYYSPYGYYGY